MNIDARARAIALCDRACHAIDRSCELAERVAASHARLARVRADLAAARRARLAQRAAAAGMRWARAVRGFAHEDVQERPLSRRTLVYVPSPTGRPQHAGAASGRVVRRPARRRGAAAREASDGASDGGDGEPREHRRGARVWAQAPVLAERAVYDASGEEWLVRELDATGLPGARRSRCLIFENHHVVRRVWHYPGDWQMIGDATLLALSEEEV